MKAYQLSKSRGKLWWTGTIEVSKIPDETRHYKYVLTEQEAIELSEGYYYEKT